MKQQRIITGCDKRWQQYHLQNCIKWTREREKRRKIVQIMKKKQNRVLHNTRINYGLPLEWSTNGLKTIADVGFRWSSVMGKWAHFVFIMAMLMSKKAPSSELELNFIRVCFFSWIFCDSLLYRLHTHRSYRTAIFSFTTKKSTNLPPPPLLPSLVLHSSNCYHLNDALLHHFYHHWDNL